MRLFLASDEKALTQLPELLGRIRAHRFDELLVPVVRGGKPFAGVSAGGVVAGPDIAPLSVVADPELQTQVTSTVALGLTDYVVYPHYDDEERGAAYPQVVWPASAAASGSCPCATGRRS